MANAMKYLAILLSFFIITEVNSKEQGNPLNNLNLSKGPQVENILGLATISTRKYQGFLGEADTEKFLKYAGNIPRKGLNSLLSFVTDKGWWAIFSFEDTGYIKDDENIDADALLSALKESQVASNEERTSLGLKKMYLIGWYTPPHYDRQTNRLEWGVRVQEEGGEENLNYSIRMLGRKGVMHVTLVSDAQSLQADLVELKNNLLTFSFNDGGRYAEYKEGDKVAEYGLSALIAGGAAAVAAKKGLFGAIAGFLAASWKFILAVFASSGKAIGLLFVGIFGWIASFIKKCFNRIFGGKK
jgi:uncharacterized membrane-anchored protein